MAQRVGESIRINGMLYAIVDVQWSPDSSLPTYILRRDFDGSLHYATCNRVTRWTSLKRIEDITHEGLDHTDVMVGMDEAYRRI